MSRSGQRKPSGPEQPLDFLAAFQASARLPRLTRRGLGKVRSFWVGLGLTVFTLGIYSYVWH